MRYDQQDRVLAADKVTVHLGVSVEDAFGNNKGQLAGLHIVEQSGERRVIRLLINCLRLRGAHWRIERPGRKSLLFACLVAAACHAFSS